MSYRLNVCLLSGIFEKSFGLTNFTRDYTALLGELNAATRVTNKATSLPLVSDCVGIREQQEAFTAIYRYKLFCKLSHFFDDFNFFINSTLSPKTKWHVPIDRRFQEFIRRVESMKIPQQIQDTIAGFLKMQRAKAALVATRENSWLVPKVLPKGDLNILYGKPKPYIPNEYLVKLEAALNKEAEIGEDGLNQFDRTRAELLQQLATTLQKFPYIRLGQLISNSIPEGSDIFYVTDDKLIQLLKDFEIKQCTN